MSKKFKISILVAIFLIVLSSIAYAASFDSYADPKGNIYLKDIEIPPEKIFFSGADIDMNIKSDSFIVVSGSTIKIDGEYNGDVVVLGYTNILIEGTFNQNLYVFGTNCTINGNIKGNLYSFAQSLTLNGKVSNDTISLASIIKMEKDSVINRDFLNFSSTVLLNGNIERNFKNFSSESIFNGKINGDVINQSDNIIINDAAVFNGKVENSGANSPVLNGNPTFKYEPNWRQIIKNIDSSTTFKLATKNFFVKFITLIIIWLLIKFIFPRFYSRSNYFATKKPLECFALGMASFIAVIVLFFILLFINYVISLSLVSFYFGLVLISSGIFVTTISTIVNKKYSSRSIGEFLSVTTTVASFIFLCELPFIGFFINILGIVFGIGYWIYGIIYDKNNFKNLTFEKQIKIEDIPNFPKSN